MCGIVGYTGFRNAKAVIIEGLKTLEYRGYDSAGIALGGERLQVFKSAGSVDRLASALSDASGTVGIGHTRWATHGSPTTKNAHPHLSFDGRIAVVHNGVIENCAELKSELAHAGITFSSETDSEVIAHMLALERSEDMLERLISVGRRLKGSASFLAIRAGDDRIYAHKAGASLAVGCGKGEQMVASDTLALAKYARQVFVLQDGEDAILSKCGVEFFKDGRKISKQPTPVCRPLPAVSPCMMRAEIDEIPAALARCHRSVNEALDDSLLRNISSSKRIYLVGSGTAYHAALYGKRALSKILPCEAVPASEFEASQISSGAQMIFISQSGETADVLQAANEAKALDVPTIALTNVPASSITFLADKTLYIDAGPEVAVAATKSYNCQLLALYELSKRLTGQRVSEDELSLLADKCREAVKVKMYEENFTKSKLFIIGKGADFITAKEGALKFKEITYRMTDAYAAGELKHGPIALIDSDSSVIVIATCEKRRIEATISELRSRGAKVTALSSLGDVGADRTFALPALDDPLLYPILSVIPLQTVALMASEALGHDPDKPRHLAKSVTVI